MTTRSLSSSSSKVNKVDGIQAVRIPTASTEHLWKQKENKPALFVRGPIPLDWLARASRLGGKALHVALLLWFRVGCERSKTVRFTRRHQELFHLKRHAAYRGLHALEEAGLVRVNRHRGRCPVVTVEVA